MTYDPKMRVALALVSLMAFLTGYILLLVWDWRIAIAVSFIHWSINIDRSLAVAERFDSMIAAFREGLRARNVDP